MKCHELCTEDRDKSLIYSSRARYGDKSSVSAGTMRLANCDNILDSHYDSLFAESRSSIKVTRYCRVVKPVHREGEIYY